MVCKLAPLVVAWFAVNVIGAAAAAQPSPPDAKPADAAGRLGIDYELMQPGQVSLGVYDSAGRQVRTLLTGVKQGAGKHSVAWDGLDRYGRAQPAGDYTWRLLRTPGFNREFLVQLGISATGGAFGDWPGNHGGPNVVTFDSGGAMYVGAVSSEGVPCTTKVSVDGTKRFWSASTPSTPPPERTLFNIAVIGEVLYQLCDDGGVYIQSSESAKLFYGHPKYRQYAEQRKALFYTTYPGDRQVPPGEVSHAHPNDFPLYMTAGKDFLLVTYLKHDCLRMFALDGSLIKEIKVKEPRGAAVGPDGRLFVVSADQVVEVDRETGAAKGLIRDPQFKHPVRLAYDPTNRDLLVAQRAPGAHNVRRYSASGGKLIASYGRQEGRRYGVWNPLDWDGIFDIAADGKGGFVTVEEFPRRVAHFTGREKHSLAREWFGGNPWGSLCFLDPADPAIVYFPGGSKHQARGGIDYAKRTWTMTHLYDLPEHFSWGNHGPNDIFPAFGGRSSFWEPRHIGKDSYLVNNGRLEGGEGVSIVRVDEQNDRLVPVARLGVLHPMSVWDPLTNSRSMKNAPKWWLDAMKRQNYPTESFDYNNLSYAWCDTNRDGRLDLDEMTVAGPNAGEKGSSAYTEAHYFVDAKLNVYRVGMGASSVKADRLSAWLKVPNEAKEGEPPIWNWNHAQPASARFDAGELERAPVKPVGIFQDAQGSIYQVCHGAAKGQDWDLPVLAWPNNAVCSTRFMKWGPGGELEWSVGVHGDDTAKIKYYGPFYAEADFSPVPPGAFAHLRGIIGEVKESIVVIDARQPATVWTRDGLYAGSFVDGRVKDEFPDSVYNDLFADDHQWGQVIETPKGEVLWCAMSGDGTPAFRIHGWEDWERRGGTLTLEAPAAPVKWGGSGLKAEYFTNQELKGEPAVARNDPLLRYGPLKGPFRVIPAQSDWFKATDPAELRGGKFSARWTGFIEAPASEAFTFSVHTNTWNWGETDRAGGSRVRLWVDDKLVIDDWQRVEDPKDGSNPQLRLPRSKPTSLKAARLVPIRLEYASGGGGADSHLHLYWRSASQDLRHVPQELLYPDLPKQN